MSEEIDDQGVLETAPPKAKTPPAPPAVEPGDMSPDEIREELERTKKALKKANAEAQANRQARQRLQELEAEDEKRQQASLSEVERERKRAAELERVAKENEAKAADLHRKYVRIQIDREVEDEARKLGVPYPRMASDMLRGRDNNGIDFDPDTGKAVGVREAVKKLIADYPDVMSPGVRRGVGTPPREAASGKPQQAADQVAIDQMALLNSSRVPYTNF